MAKTAISCEEKRSSSFYGGLLCTLVILLSSIAIQLRDDPLLNEYLSKNISSTKPYETFEEFYPYYLREHTQKITRQWHYVGTTLTFLYFVTQPILSIPLIRDAPIPILTNSNSWNWSELVGIGRELVGIGIFMQLENLRSRL